MFTIAADFGRRLGVMAGHVRERVVASTAAALGAALVLAAPAAAQNGGIVGPGNVVVTGFAGTIAAPAPPGEDPFDYVTINPDGPSAEVIDLSNLGPQGQLSDALKTFAISAAQVGQVFGVAIDNAPQPNIYLAATSAYGLSIYLPDGTESVRRIRVGTPGAQFVPGQFGPPGYGGSPGSIWRVDGVTGEAYLFATVDAAAQGAASLGGLAFDPATQQLFVADRGTGIIHRFGLDGYQRGTYDHGIEGRPKAGLAPLPYVPGIAFDINSPAFSTEAPSTWGFAPPGRRVFGLAVKGDRLYYAIAQGPQVWSVGISRTGALAATPRLEVEVPALQDGIEIASIAFDSAGRMYLAERGPVTGDYELTRLAASDASRVLRYGPKPAGDGGPGLWRLVPDQYAIGLAPAYMNANGGVALGYGYRMPGVIDLNACRSTLWSTGGRLLDGGDGTLPPGYFQTVDGLQGNATTLVMPQNAPPVNSWFVDYNDTPGNPDFRGHMGALTIFNPCANDAPYVPPPPPVTCPPGTVLQDGQCIVTVTCPPGSVFKNGVCVYQTCPPGYVLNKGKCIPPPITCGPGFAFYDGRCVPLDCPPGMQRMPNGQCICPVGNLYYDGRCVPPSYCPPGMVQSPNGICWCPAGTQFLDGRCIPNFCPNGYVTIDGRCVPDKCPPGFFRGPGGACLPIVVPCGIGEILVNGRCLPKVCPPGQQLRPDGSCHWIGGNCRPGEIFVNGKCVPQKCPPFQELGNDGRCRPIDVNCPKGMEFDHGKCVPTCRPGDFLVNGKCVPQPARCNNNEEWINGKCVPKCRNDETLVNGKCVPKPSRCNNNEEWINGKCVPKCRNDETLVNGKCVPKPSRCNNNEEWINGKCVPKCRNDETLVNGKCVPKPSRCNNNEEWINGKCVPKCRNDETLVNGKCVPKPPQCKNGEEWINGKCVPKCRNDETLVNGKCVPKPPQCKNGEEVVNGKCVPKCGKDQTLVNGKCVAKPPQCNNNQQLVDGKCVAKCGKGETLVNGKCVAKPNCKKGEHVVDGKCVSDCRKGEQLVNGKCVPKSGSLDPVPGAADLAALTPDWLGAATAIPASAFPWAVPQAASAPAWSALRAVSRVPETMSCSTSCSLEFRM